MGNHHFFLATQSQTLTSLLGHPHREMSHEDVRHLSQLMAAELVVEPTHGKNMLESQNGFIFLQIGVKMNQKCLNPPLRLRLFPCGTYHHFFVYQKWHHHSQMENPITPKKKGDEN